MNSLEAPRRRGSRLAGRLALRLALLVGALAAAVAWISLLWVEATFERQLGRQLDSIVQRVDGALAQHGTDLVTDLARLEDDLRRDHVELLERLLSGGAGVADAAARLGSAVRIPQLELIDDEGRVLSSADRPERAGLADPRLLQIPTASAVLHVEHGGESGGLLSRSRRTIAVGERRLHVVGSRPVDEAVLDRIAPGAAALLILEDGSSPVHSRSAGLGAVAVRGLAAGEHRECGGDDGSQWLATAVRLGEESAEPVARLVLAVDRAPIEQLLARLRGAFLGLPVVAGLLAALAGVWIARGLTRPVEGMVRAVEAIGQGQADYTFPAPAGDEFDELVTSFSRLQRSLELQRERARAAERVAAWREVARRVAHEVKNPLAPIRLTIENLRRAREGAPDRFDQLFRDGTRTILEEVDQLARMVGAFSEFARLPLPRRERVRLDGLLDAVVELHEAEPGLRIERSYDDSIPALDLDPDQISRALKNIVGNAVESLRTAPAGDHRVEVHATAEEDWVRVEIADNGPGFSDDALPRIFEPYFTTKDGGTGLGLAMTYRIVIEHGGLVEAENREGGGARIVLRFPRNAAGKRPDR